MTNAKGGQFNHNFGIAGDSGVFRGKSYLDDSNPELASKVHKACSMHAADCGLEWGGSWKSMTDQPHYEVATGLSMMQKRNVYKLRGSAQSPSCRPRTSSGCANTSCRPNGRRRLRVGARATLGGRHPPLRGDHAVGREVRDHEKVREVMG